MKHLANLIKSSLSMHDVAVYYGYTPNSRGFITCPFHTEKSASLKIYKEPGKGFHCFGCGAGGSVIDFVMGINNLSFAEAVKQMNVDFGFNYDIEKPDYTAIKRAEQQRKKEAEFKAWVTESYNTLAAYHCFLWQIKLWFAPESREEEPSRVFIKAVQEIKYINYLCDCLLDNPVGFYKAYGKVVSRIASTREF